MVLTGEMEWKRYYREERVSRREEIKRRLEEYLSSDDPPVDRILGSGGALSFPHTHLDHSMIPVVRTVAGILRGGYGQIIALGVFHRMSEWDVKQEFSLDGFLDILDLAVEISGCSNPDVSSVYLPRKREIVNDIEGTVSDLMDLGKEIARGLNENTALVMTGDLVHYGYGYGFEDPLEDPTDLINRWVREELDDVYLGKDYISYLPKSSSRMSDHGYVAVAASAILGPDLRYEIISSENADYSRILQVPSPTLVASVLYGVYPFPRHHGSGRGSDSG
ncbi:MAG: hypothetical protein ACMUIG_06145 [Thermoplasmatota archaeon]